MNKKNLEKFIKIVILIVLIALFFATQDASEIYGLIKSVNLIYFVPFLLLFLLSTALSTCNLAILLKKFTSIMPWRKLFSFELLSTMGAFYSPGGIGGPAITLMLLKNHGVKASNAFAILLVDKLITAFVAGSSIILFSFLFVLDGYQIGLNKIYWISVVIATISILIFFCPPIKLRLINLWGEIKVLGNFPGALIVNFSLSCLNFICCGIQYLLAFLAIHIFVENPFLVISSYGVFVAVNYLPISIGGIGLNEVLAISLWRDLHLSSESVIATFLVLRVFALISALIAAFLGAAIK